MSERIGCVGAPADKHSLKTRYLHKLTANLFAFGINIVIAGITPRGLGAKSYGDYNFLTSFFTEVKTFFDGGVSIGFYNKFSHRQNENALVHFYLRFLALASAIILILVALCQFSGLYPHVWPAQKISYVYLAALSVILMWFSQGFDYMVDAFGLTVYSERARMLQKFTGLLLLSALFISGILNLKNYFIYQYVNYLLLIGLFAWIMRVRGHFLFSSIRVTLIQAKKYIHEFYHYSFPLFIYSAVCLVTGILDRWLLQVFGGSIQQGFYGLSYYIGVMCFLFTSAMTPLIIRDYSIAFAEKNIKRIAEVFRRYIPMLYAVAAYFACFIAVNSNKVVYILGGNEYESAGLAVKIMAFYPVHQTYGQLSSSLLLSINRTKLYRNIGIILAVSGLVVTYFLIAPFALMGLNMGATGLAAKMVVMNIIGVNIFLFFNCRFLKISFREYIFHQGLPLLIFVPIAVLTAYVCDSILKLNSRIVMSFLLSGFLYTLSVAIATYCFPAIFGLKRGHIDSALLRLSNMVFKRKS